MNWINLPALEYALLEYDADSKEERIVVVELYYHSDERGYTYPSVKGIARRWGMDRETVRDHFTALLVKRAIFPTKKRRGETGQIKVYRLPKFLWQRGSQSAPLSDGKEAGKGRERGGKGVAKPPRTRKKEEGTKNNSEERAEVIPFLLSETDRWRLLSLKSFLLFLRRLRCRQRRRMMSRRGDKSFAIYIRISRTPKFE